MEKELSKKDIINRWEQLGFLDGLNDIKKLNISQSFEYAAKFILSYSEMKKYSDIQTILFPIIRRVFTPIENEIDKKVIKSKTIELIEDLAKQNFKPETQDCYGWDHIDPEAEWCAAYSDNYKLNL